MPKNRKKKLQEYQEKYKDIPLDQEDRLRYIIDKYNISEKKMDEIILKKRNIEGNIKFSKIKIVLYEEPEGYKRHRFRVINRSNYPIIARELSSFVHVYSPNAHDDNKYMNRLIDQDLIDLENHYIQTPCHVILNSYSKTPSYYNTTDIVLSEIGLHRNTVYPDLDNIEKKYFDMFNENVWKDDNLVVSVTANKFYSILPRIEIFIHYMNCVTNHHQYKQITNAKNYKEDYPISYLDNMGRII